MAGLDIQNIVNEKVASMIDNSEIQKKIEDTVEKELLNAIAHSVSNWEIQKILKNKIETEISTSLSILDFKGYTNKIIKQIANIIEKEQNKELADKVLKEFKDLYIKPENLEFTLDELISKYTEYVKEMDDDEYCDKYANWKITDNTPGLTYSKWYKILLSTNEDFETDYGNYTYEIQLQSIDREFKKFKITSIYEDGKYSKDLTKRLKLGILGSFEQFLINVYYNEIPIIEVEEEDGEKYLGDD